DTVAASVRTVPDECRGILTEPRAGSSPTAAASERPAESFYPLAQDVGWLWAGDLLPIWGDHTPIERSLVPCCLGYSNASGKFGRMVLLVVLRASHAQGVGAGNALVVPNDT